VSDLDLSIGAYLGFIACVTATWLPTAPLLGIAVILGSIAVYGALGALVQLRQLPSIVVIGGTSVTGGMANVPGLWGAALMLFLGRREDASTQDDHGLAAEAAERHVFDLQIVLDPILAALAAETG
jgi:ribose/xylose/arabinose/galactoside ABC-type transport system permease subunit